MIEAITSFPDQDELDAQRLIDQGVTTPAMAFGRSSTDLGDIRFPTSQGSLRDVDARAPEEAVLQDAKNPYFAELALKGIKNTRNRIAREGN